MEEPISEYSEKQKQSQKAGNPLPELTALYEAEEVRNNAGAERKTWS